MIENALLAFRIYFIEESQHQPVLGDIGHRVTVMLVAYPADFINEEQGRQPADLEKFPFLAVKIGNLVPRVWQTDEGQSFAFPIALERLRTIRTYCDDDRVTRGKGRHIIAQLREMGTAVGSHEPAQEDEDDILFAKKIGQAGLISIDIHQFEIRRILHFIQHKRTTSLI